jgi:hypothetical protein
VRNKRWTGFVFRGLRVYKGDIGTALCGCTVWDLNNPGMVSLFFWRATFPANLCVRTRRNTQVKNRNYTKDATPCARGDASWVGGQLSWMVLSRYR